MQDPAKRITLKEALRHPFLAEVRARAEASTSSTGMANARIAARARTLREEVESEADPLRLKFKLRKADLVRHRAFVRCCETVLGCSHTSMPHSPRCGSGF